MKNETELKINNFEDILINNGIRQNRHILGCMKIESKENSEYKTKRKMPKRKTNEGIGWRGYWLLWELT